MINIGRHAALHTKLTVVPVLRGYQMGTHVMDEGAHANTEDTPSQAQRQRHSCTGTAAQAKTHLDVPLLHDIHGFFGHLHTAGSPLGDCWFAGLTGTATHRSTS